MNLPNYERGITAALSQAIEAVDGKQIAGSETRGTSLLGTIQLEDGRSAQIHVVVTTNPDDFIE